MRGQGEQEKLACSCAAMSGFDLAIFAICLIGLGGGVSVSVVIFVCVARLVQRLQYEGGY